MDVLLSRDYSHAEKINRILTHCSLKYPDQYLGGVDDLTVKWIKQGTQFRVTEYDGSESLEFHDGINWITA